MVANYLTAYAVLHRAAGVSSAERVLVHGAAGGVGTALLEPGKLAGLEMYGTASRHNHELVSALGATPIDYRTEDFVGRIRSLTGDGVDAVFDPIAGARQLWRSYRALRKGGRLVWFGVAATSTAGVRVIPLSLLTRFLPVRLDDLVQWIPPADNWPELSGLDQFLEVPHHLHPGVRGHRLVHFHDPDHFRRAVPGVDRCLHGMQRSDRTTGRLRQRV